MSRRWVARAVRTPCKSASFAPVLTHRLHSSFRCINQVLTRKRSVRALEAEIAALVGRLAPDLVAEPGCGPLTAAKLVGEIAGAQRFASDAKLARAAGIAPIPISSGKTDRHRLERGGNRQINAAIHRIAITRPLPPRNPRLHRPQTGRRQDDPGRHPLPQATSHPPHLAAPAAAQSLAKTLTPSMSLT